MSAISGLRERLERAARESLQAAPSFRIVAVSKRHPVTKIKEAHSEGHRIFGENYAAELAEKAAELADSDIDWHFIGHLQRNKVAKVVGVASLIHAVDSERLLIEIDKRAAAAGIIQHVLIAVSLAGEAQKSGVPAIDCPALVSAAASLAHVDCQGLMTMPPLAGDSRPYFAELRQLRERLASPDQPLAELSMGTSADCDAAVAEGATLVRVGTALFGSRPTGVP